MPQLDVAVRMLSQIDVAECSLANVAAGVQDIGINVGGSLIYSTHFDYATPKGRLFHASAISHPNFFSSFRSSFVPVLDAGSFVPERDRLFGN